MYNVGDYYGRSPWPEQNFHEVRLRVAAAEHLIYVQTEVLKPFEPVVKVREGAEASVTDTLLEHINHQLRPR
jgi:hypothetical protein